MQRPDRPVFVEVFAGTAGLSQAISARGMQILPPIEIEPNNFVTEPVDILDPLVFRHLQLLIEENLVAFIHFGTPCSSFSIARKNDGGPPPLRDRQHLWGRRGLSAKDLSKLEMGNKFLELTVLLARQCHQHGIPWSIENPASSFLWLMPPMEELAALPSVTRFVLDMCRFGAPHKKPTAILSSADLSALALECDMAERPHVHEPLVGYVVVDDKKVFKTKLAQVYPTALCRAWAAVIVPVVHDPLAATFQMITPPADRKRSVGQAVPWKPHKLRLTAEKASAAGYQLKRAALPPLLKVELEPGQAVQAALSVQHPFTLEPALEPDLQEALALVAFSPQRVLGHRAGALQYWSARAQDLLPHTEQILHSVSDPHLRLLLRGVPDDHTLELGKVTHIALWHEMLTAAKCIDRTLPDALLQGFSIVGPIQRSQRWAALAMVDELLPVQALASRAWEFSDKVTKNVSRCEVTENTAKIWEATLEDVREGSSLGPFFSAQEVSSFLGTKEWIPTQRFEVVQKNKVRGVDSATVNGINMATFITEKIELPSTDVNVAALRWLRSNAKGANIQGWVLDERKAYRQIAVRPDQRKWSVIALKEPLSGKIAFFVMIGHSFGLVAAVYNYNRRSAAITDILRRLFFVAAFNFYDDKYGFEPECTCSSAFDVAQKVHWWLGAQFDPKKLQLCFDPTILGVTYDLRSMHLKIKPSRKDELLQEIDAILESQVFPPSQAGKLRGKLMFGASQLWGKIGRAFLRSLSERQYTKSNQSALNKAIVLSLEHWRWLIVEGPPRPILETKPRSADYVLFTDGSFTDGKPGSPLKPWIGGVLFRLGEVPLQFGCEVNQSLIKKWLPRKSQIAMVELFATVVALKTFEAQLSNSWSLLLVDSEPVQGALVKGYSAREDVCELVGVFWKIAFDLKVNLYVDRVPTDANPADPPSRDRMCIGAYIWLGLTMWLAMHACLRANAATTHMLTRFVRLPIPANFMLDRARKFLGSWEEQPMREVLRIPWTRHQYSSTDEQSYNEGMEIDSFSVLSVGRPTSEDEAAQRRTRHGIDVPSWYRKEQAIDTGEPFESMMPLAAQGTAPEHFEVYREIQNEWWPYDVYARISIFLAFMKLSRSYGDSMEVLPCQELVLLGDCERWLLVSKTDRYSIAAVK
eukprot:s92_g30.t1